jgi:hypothetical protein
MAKPSPKRTPPMMTENIVSRTIKRLIYFWRGVCSSPVFAEAAKLAI